MRLLFLSSDPISLPCLKALAAGTVPAVEVCGVVSNPDQRRGRGKKWQRNPVAEAAEALGLPTLQTARLRAEELTAFASFDAALVFAFGQILPRSVLALCPGKFLNFHASPLPLLRGASPIETAVAEGWTGTEVCLMRIVPAMDAGAVGKRIPIPMAPEETAPSLRQKIADDCRTLLSFLAPSEWNGIEWREQDERAATYCRKIHKSDALIDFSLPAKKIYDRFRAFDGWPGTSFRLRGEILRVEDVRIENRSGPPGEILAADERLLIATGHQSISIGRLQRPTKKMLPFPQARPQINLTVGDRLGFPLSHPLVRS